MSHKNFNRGRGFGPRGAFRPRFPGLSISRPFRHGGPSRPGHPVPFPGMPWQANNRFFQPHMLRGNPQFRPGGRKKRFYSYDVRFPAPNVLPPLYEGAVYEAPPYWSDQVENNQAEPQAAPQPPLPGSEEERKQKITETADRLKQKLSCISNNEMLNIWADDVSVNAEDNSAENTSIPVHRYEPSELVLTNSDLKDVEEVNSDNLNSTDVFNVVNNINRDVMLDENNDGSQVENIFDGNRMTSLINVPINECVDEGEQDESIDASYNLEQSNLHQDINIENELLESNVQSYDISLANISQDQCEQQQDIPQVRKTHKMEQNKMLKK